MRNFVVFLLFRMVRIKRRNNYAGRNTLEMTKCHVLGWNNSFLTESHALNSKIKKLIHYSFHLDRQLVHKNDPSSRGGL